MFRANEIAFQELLAVANSNQDQFKHDDAISRQLVIDMSVMQRELSALRLPTPVSPPNPRRAPSQTSQRSDSQEAKR
jgi:hypothetical protein